MIRYFLNYLRKSTGADLAKSVKPRRIGLVEQLERRCTLSLAAMPSFGDARTYEAATISGTGAEPGRMLMVIAPAMRPDMGNVANQRPDLPVISLTGSSPAEQPPSMAPTFPRIEAGTNFLESSSAVLPAGSTFEPLQNAVKLADLSSLRSGANKLAFESSGLITNDHADLPLGIFSGAGMPGVFLQRLPPLDSQFPHGGDGFMANHPELATDFRFGFTGLLVTRPQFSLTDNSQKGTDSSDIQGQSGSGVASAYRSGNSLNVLYATGMGWLTLSSDDAGIDRSSSQVQSPRSPTAETSKQLKAYFVDDGSTEDVESQGESKLESFAWFADRDTGNSNVSSSRRLRQPSATTTYPDRQRDYTFAMLFDSARAYPEQNLWMKDYVAYDRYSNGDIAWDQTSTWSPQGEGYIVLQAIPVASVMQVTERRRSFDAEMISAFPASFDAKMECDVSIELNAGESATARNPELIAKQARPAEEMVAIAEN
jgi:hypothetical protein